MKLATRLDLLWRSSGARLGSLHEEHKIAGENKPIQEHNKIKLWVGCTYAIDSTPHVIENLKGLHWDVWPCELHVGMSHIYYKQL